MLGVVASKVLPVLKFGQQLSTTRNNMQQRAKGCENGRNVPLGVVGQICCVRLTGLHVTSIMFCFESLLTKIFTVHQDAPNFCVDSDL